MNPQIFRAYDVRGVAERDLTHDVAKGLGQAFGSEIKAAGGSRICLGRDCRVHGQRLRDSLLEGILSTGVDVIDVGVVASPLLYFAVFHHDADGGVQITGSHNPAEYNGFKLMLGKSTLHGEKIQRLRERIEDGNFATGQGSSCEEPVTDTYVNYVAQSLELGKKRLKIVVDGGNGTGGPPAVALLQKLGVEVVPLYVDMDGTFPNHHPDPTVAENLSELIERVQKEQADLGVAYDGDADRIGVVDDKGDIIWGDRLMIMLSRDILRDNPGATIVSEVKCSRTLFDDIAAHGGRPIMSKVGHSIIKDRMKVENALLGGEMSGHIFYRHRWFGFDDAIYTTGRLIEILSRSDEPLSNHLADVPKTHVTPEIRLPCDDLKKFVVVEAAVRYFTSRYPVVDIDGARVDFGEGWGLIRASNTQPVIVMRAEADTADALVRIQSILEDFVLTHSKTIEGNHGT